MGVSTATAVLKQIASGKPDSIYLLQGEDEVEKSALAAEFAGLVEEGLQAFNVERIHAGEMTTGDKLEAGVASIVAAVRTLPMMSPWRVVIVPQSDVMLAPKRESEAAERAHEDLVGYFERPDPQTVLVLVAATLDRRSRMYKLLGKVATVVECGTVVDQADAERWVRTHVAAGKATIDPAAVRFLAARAGPDVRRLRGEVDRLLLYALGQTSITMDDVKALAGPAALLDDWAMTNAIEEARTGEALRQLTLMLDAGAAPEKVLGQLGWLVRSKFPAIAPRQLEPAVDALFRTDLDLKRSAGDPRILLERLVVELCQPRAARRVDRRDL